MGKYDLTSKYTKEKEWSDPKKEKDFYKDLLKDDPEAKVQVGGNKFYAKYYLNKL